MFEVLKERAAGKFYYLASPYSHSYVSVRTARAHASNNIAGRLMTKGLYVYQPIWSTHRIALEHDLPMDFEWWEGYNRAFIDPSAGVIVTKDIEGWDTSRGVRHEIDYARSIGLPVYSYAWGKIEEYNDA